MAVLPTAAGKKLPAKSPIRPAPVKKTAKAAPTRKGASDPKKTGERLAVWMA